MQFEKLISEIGRFKNTGTEQARLQRHRFNFENEFIRMVYIETSNKLGGESVVSGKLWSLKFILKQSFVHLKGWVELQKHFGSLLEITPVKGDSEISSYFGIRLRQMSKEPSDEIVKAILDFIFQEVRDSDLLADDQLKNDIEKIVSQIKTKTERDVPAKPAAAVDTPAGKAYKRDPDISAQALFDADYMCESGCAECLYFERKKNGNNYTEPHHLIPMRYQGNFLCSLDVVANIVSLCSHCHNHLHYGRGIETILRRLYSDRAGRLRDSGLDVFDDLLNLY